MLMVYPMRMKIKDPPNGLTWRMMAWVAQVFVGHPALAAKNQVGTMRQLPGIILFIIVLKGKKFFFGTFSC